MSSAILNRRSHATLAANSMRVGLEVGQAREERQGQLTKCTILRVCRKWSPLATSNATRRAMPEFGNGLPSALWSLYQWYRQPWGELMARYRSPFSKYSVTRLVWPSCRTESQEPADTLPSAQSYPHLCLCISSQNRVHQSQGLQDPCHNLR